MRYLKAVYSVLALLVFVLVMLLVLPFALLTMLFGTVQGGNLLYKVCRAWALIWYTLVGIRHEDVYETPDDPQRQFVFVANHSSYMDIPPIVLAIRQPLRVLGKYEMVRYPVFGWIYRMAVIVVDRSSPERRAKSLRALKAALKKGISIFIFPEGTFNETDQPLKEMYNGAFKLAIEMQVPLRILVLPDAERRLHWSSLLALSPGRNRVVHVATLETEGLMLDKMDWLKTETARIMSNSLLKYRN